MKFQFFSHNSQLMPVENATVPLSNIEYSYGFGVYETLRVKSGVAYFLEQHIERLLASATIIGLQHTFTSAMIAQSVADLIARTDSPAFNIKILLIGGRTADDANLYILCLNPLFPDRRLYRDGVATITVEYERQFPHAKTLNMLGSYLAYEKARAHGAYDALLVDKAGNIIEGTRTNFFAMKDKTIFSPLEEKILLGVTRAAVLAVAKENGYELWEGDINRSHLPDYDSAFLTSTSSNIMPISRVDEHEFKAQSAPLRALMAAFDRFLDSCGGKL